MSEERDILEDEGAGGEEMTDLTPDGESAEEVTGGAASMYKEQ